MRKRLSNVTYYISVLRLAQQYASDAQSIIDVGAPWPFVTAFDWIPNKVMLNDRYPEGLVTPPDVEAVLVDFYEFEPREKYDLVICNQVMEHVPDPASFAKKLLSIGHTVIASVPYMWPEGTAPGHLQNDIDVETLLSWCVIFLPIYQSPSVCRQILVAFFEGGEDGTSAVLKISLIWNFNSDMYR